MDQQEDDFEHIPKELKFMYLKQRQGLPPTIKVQLSKRRIVEWYEKHNGRVYVSFSGGRDSTVLLHLVRSVYPEVPAVFADTGLEYPEVRDFVKNTENVIWVKPKYTFKQVLEKWGYPIVSKEVAQKIHGALTSTEYMRNKRMYGDKNGNGKIPNKWMHLLGAPFKISSYCCQAIKKSPLQIFGNTSGLAPYVGILAEESNQRKQSFALYGCNAFKSTHPSSRPLMFWDIEDIKWYLEEYKVPYSKIYDLGWEGTGCMFCMFGVHREEHPNRFERLKELHPDLYDYCINKLEIGKVLDYLKVSY